MTHHEHKVDWIKSFYDSAADWWGTSWYNGENLEERLQTIREYGNRDDKRILELGAGTGETAAYLCDHGYSVTAVDISKRNIELMHEMKKKRPSLRVVEGDFLKVRIKEKFPTICMFETFGMGSDQDQKELLKRINKNWLQDGGVLILDLYHPSGPIKAAGTKRILERLENVPGSVEMTEYSYYDGIKNRWIDIWEPINNKASARIQSVRCYSPADLFLLLEGTGLTVQKLQYKGQEIDFESDEIKKENAFKDCERIFYYTAILKGEMK
jgi:SAM-dependent methyltransferase